MSLFSVFPRFGIQIIPHSIIKLKNKCFYDIL